MQSLVWLVIVVGHASVSMGLVTIEVKGTTKKPLAFLH